MIVRPDVQYESPYFHRLWYFYLNWDNQCTEEDKIEQVMLSVGVVNIHVARAP